LLQKPAKIKTQNNHPALMLSEASVWYAKLRSRSGIATLALEFCTLTAARSGEVRGATWSEIEGDLWILPAKRTKTGQEHRIPLSSRSIEILAQMPKSNAIIFPNTRGGQLSDAALSACMKRINNSTENGFLDRISGRPAVPHGLRSTFRDWAAELTEFPSDMAEIALSHKVGSAVERAYRRGDMLTKRRQMMEQWFKFLEQSRD